MRTLALLDESREEYERRRVLIAQRVAEGSQLQQQVEESRKRVAAAREETASHEEELALAARLPTERAACADGLRDARAAEGRGRVALALLEAEAAAEAAEAVKGAAAASG